MEYDVNREEAPRWCEVFRNDTASVSPEKAPP